MDAGKTFTNLIVCLSFWIGIVLILLTVQGNFNNKATATPIAAEPEPLESVIAKSVTGKGEVLVIRDASSGITAGPDIKVEISGQIKRGESFDLAMKRLKVPDPVRLATIKGFGKSIDFRMLQPGDHFTIALDKDNAINHAVYQSGLLKSYILQRSDDGGLAVTRQAIPLECRVERIIGVIESSLYAAFLDMGEEPKLIHAYADIFASRIDFNTEPRKGDRFELLVEKYYKDKKFVGYGKILTARYLQKNIEYQGYFYRSDNTPAGYFDQSGEALGTWFIRSPIPFGRVTSRFTMRRKHPVYGDIRPHLGVDLAAPKGTPVMAAADGKVEFVGRRGGFGKTVILKHHGGYKTYYGHLNGYKKGLKKGSEVRQKDIIGYVGSTGVATGPHLDYRIQYNGVFKNPFGIKFKAKTVLRDEELTAFLKTRSEIANLFESEGKEKILQVKNIILSDDHSISFL